METQNEIEALKADMKADREALEGVSATVDLLRASLHLAQDNLTK